MAKRILTCYYCKQKFDANSEPFKQVSARRYAHKACAEKNEESVSQEEKDKQALLDYINILFDGKQNYALVAKQIKDFVSKNNYSYNGIRKALVYFYEIKKNSIEKANGGLGIVPYIYNDAYNYYYSIWEANQKNEAKQPMIKQYQVPEICISIKRPERNIKVRKLFTFLDEELDNNGK